MAAIACLAAMSAAAGPHGAQPTTSVPVAAGWTARFFVSPNVPERNLLGEPVLRRNALGVNARLAKELGGGVRLSVDATNLMGREAPSTVDQLLAPPAGRGVRIELRKSF